MKLLFTVGTQLHGKGSVVFKWHPDGTYLASCGVNRRIHIFDRHGEDYVQEFHIKDGGNCKSLEWDRNGEVLAALVEGSSSIILWELSTRNWEVIETNMKDPSFLKWSKIGPQLAVGTAKGNLLIFNYRNKKMIPIMGKHTKRITCGAWNKGNKLALGSEDKQITISDDEGNTVDQFTVKNEPVEIQFSDMKMDGRSAHQESTVSINIGRKSLFLHNMNDPDDPIELQFQSKYGNIVSYQWFGDGYILLAFSNGYIIVASSHMHEIQGEIFSQKLHKDGLNAMSVSNVLNKAASCGNDSVRLLELRDWSHLKDETLQLDVEGGVMDSIDWTNDGQILSVNTKTGCIFNFLAKIPVLSAAWETQVAYMTSLRELCILDAANPQEESKSLTVATEPSLVSLGPTHVAISMNTQVWFYNCAADAGDSYTEKGYSANVQDIRINEVYAAVLTDGKVLVHPLEEGCQESEHRFPEKDDGSSITCMALTPDFLIYATSRGVLSFRHSERVFDDEGAIQNNFDSVCEQKHDAPIISIFPNPPGTKLVFIDNNHMGFFYDPVTQQIQKIKTFPQTATKVLWDAYDPGVFVVSDPKSAHTFVYSSNSIQGTTIKHIGSSKLKHGLTPVCMNNGKLTCQEPSGALAQLILDTHGNIGNEELSEKSTEKLRSCFNHLVMLLRLKEAWEAALLLDDKDIWTTLSRVAMEQMDIELAIRVHRQLGDAGMVISLQKISDVEDRSLLAGHIALLFQSYPEAQDLFLNSSRPIAALEMRRDLLHWSDALKLAKTLAPKEIPHISKAYAQQLEFKGEHQNALQMYNKGLTGEHESEHDKACYAGIARTTVRCGDTQKGIAIAHQLNDKQVYCDVAGILYSMKQSSEAASLYEKGRAFEKAVTIYIEDKNFSAATPLMNYVHAPRLHQKFAQKKEQLGSFEEAAVAYEKAKDLDSVVRLYVDKLKRPERAIEIVRESGSVEGAKLVATFCQSRKDHRAAIEFHIMAKQGDEAFDLAQAHDAMDVYTKFLGENGTPDEYDAIARYYETKANHEQAGDFYAMCGQYQKALNLFLMCGETVLDKAIDVVGKARNEILNHQMIDYLMGETDDVPKDPNYIFRLYMALRNFVQAAKTAIIIARQEQGLGNYKYSHDLLYETHKDLEAQNIKIPRELTHNLMLLHSYVLVKMLVKQGDHKAGARMLIRVAKNISRFPMHQVPILTSTVIECQRSGLKRSAFEYACVLMRPEHRKDIDAKYKKKIEQIVRKPDKAEDDEETTPCPYCKTDIPDTILECHSCKNTIPYCIVTGKHMVASDWSVCPSCRFPCLYTPFVTYLTTNKQCPMCNQDCLASSVTKVDDPSIYLRKATEVEGDADAEEGGE